MPSAAEKRGTYRRLHESGCFVLPNPWDVGSARYLQHLAFKALASTSAGFAFTQGRPDNAVPRDVMLAHLRDLAAATDVPLNADFENSRSGRPSRASAAARTRARRGPRRSGEHPPGRGPRITSARV